MMEMSNYMPTDTDRRIELIYRAGLKSIKTLYHFRLPKCEQPGCFRKLSAKDDKHGHTLCEICYNVERKAKRVPGIKQAVHNE
jgi:hypothetical protein